MTIANRLSIFLPCFLLLFSIPASAGDSVVRKKPGRTTNSKTASGVTNTDTEIEALSRADIEERCCPKRQRIRKPPEGWFDCKCDSKSPDGVDQNDNDSPGVGTGDDIVTAYSHTNSRGQTYRGPVGWDLGAVAIEYATMASLMGYSDSEAIEYGIIVALIHVGTAPTDSDSESRRTGNNVVVIWP
jgi:hypothetical protein|tara:strand:+ start:68 stop:625 length:558 start_codon:yes stop_codon:yes gene_type:complete